MINLSLFNQVTDISSLNKKQIETTADEAIKEFEDIKVDLEKVLNN